jgi:hypothetical protein
MDGFRFKAPNKYRRAFDWRVSYANRDSTGVEARAMARLATSDFPDILEDFLEIGRKRRANWTALSRLQMHMLEELLVQEGAVKHYRNKLRAMEGESSPASDEHLPKETLFAKQELFFYRSYANAVRGIGDGIAWRTLGYDRAVTRLMSERETKQNLASEGLLQELWEWSHNFESGNGIAILNALTNCLAVGDVTVVRADDSVEIVEVKSSNTKSSRKVRQKQKMSEVVTLLGAGAGRTEDREVRIEILPITPETGLDQIGQLLEIAGREGIAAKRISNCLYIEAFDVLRMEDTDALHKRIEQMRDAAVGEWKRRGDFVVELSSLDRLAFTPNCAPFSVYPFTARTCVELLIGQKFYITYLNENAVGREFENRGWVVEKNSAQLVQEEGDKDAVMAVRKGRLHVWIPPADFMRMQMEALRAKSLIEALEATLAQGPDAEQGALLALYEGESAIWD